MPASTGVHGRNGMSQRGVIPAHCARVLVAFASCLAALSATVARPLAMRSIPLSLCQNGSAVEYSKGSRKLLQLFHESLQKQRADNAMLRCGKEYHSPPSIVLQNEILCVIPPQDARYRIDLVSMMIWTVGIVVNTCRDIGQLTCN